MLEQRLRAEEFLRMTMPKKLIKGENIKKGNRIKATALQKKRKVSGFGIWKSVKPFKRDEKFLEGSDRLR